MMKTTNNPAKAARYEYLLFDLDNTLMDFHAGEKAALMQTMAERGAPIDESGYLAYREINREVWGRFERGLLDSAGVQRERFERFLAQLGQDPAGATALNAAYVVNLGQQAIPFDGARELLERLRERYRLAAVTNGLTLVQRERLKRSAFDALFDGVFISQEMGLQKPDKAYFEHVLSRFGDGEKSKYLMIGDSLTADIRGGINAGIDTCWLRPKGAEARGDIRPTYIADGFDDLLRLLGCESAER
jgi:YjjG family noncanonical pyrimidine nucleotidase